MREDRWFKATLLVIGVVCGALPPLGLGAVTVVALTLLVLIVAAVLCVGLGVLIAEVLHNR